MVGSGDVPAGVRGTMRDKPFGAHAASSRSNNLESLKHCGDLYFRRYYTPPCA